LLHRNAKAADPPALSTGERTSPNPDSRLGAVVRLRICDLRPADSPRANGIDHEHVSVLANVEGDLPPIVVHRETMSVVDGMHRLSAAIMANRTEINAVFFHGTSAEAFRVGVAANVSHGLPLTLAERRSAAIRIVKAQPGLSDRAVAETTGLSSKTVAAIRQQLQVTSEPVRMGRDGRLRPMSTAEGRLAASRLMIDKPQASLREVAQAAGVSVGTARDVRHRLQAGRDPVPERQQINGNDNGNGNGKVNNERPKPRTRSEDNTDALLVFECLQRDPSLRYSESGRRLLRDLRHRMVTAPHLRRWLEDMPPHTTVSIAKIARTCERAWSEFAEQLERTTL